MEQELRIKIKIDKQTGELSTVNAELNKLSDSTQKTSNHQNKLKESTNMLAGAFSSLKGIVASYIGLEAFKTYAKTSDAMALLEARIKLVSKESDNYASTQKQLTRIANENRVAYGSVGELFSRLSPAMQTLHADTSTVIDITDSYSKSLLISGASAEEAAGSTRQFSQAMASGVLRGEEFNSMMENSPRASRILMDTLGKTQGELRKMAENGELASGIVAGALLRSLGQMKDEASKMPNTISGEFQRIKNEASLTVETFNKLTGANTYIADTLSIATKKIVEFREELPQVNKHLDDFIEQHKYAYAVVKALADLMGSFGAQTVNSVENSSSVMGQLLESSGRGFIGWIDNIGKTLESYGLLNVEIEKTNSTISIVPSRPFEESRKQVDDLATAVDTLNKKMFNYNSLLFPEKMSLAPLVDLQKQRELAASALEKDGKEAVATTKRIKESTAAINTQMAALEKQYSIQKEIKNLDVESALIAEKITKPQAEYLKEINDIKSQIAKNQETINLLNAIEYDKKNDQNWETDQLKNLEKANGLKKDNELLTRKEIAAEEKKQATIKAMNEEVRMSIASLNVSETDKSYLDLTQKVKELVTSGADLKLVGDYAEKLANQIARDDTYAHLQKEFDIQKDMIELTMFGSEKETALENVRHKEVMASLKHEFDTKKINEEEYLQLLNTERIRHQQNSDAFYKFMVTAFDNVDKALDSQFFDALTGKFVKFNTWLKDTFKATWTAVAQGLSRTVAGSLMDSVRSSVLGNYSALSMNSLASGSVVTAGEIATIMNQGGTFDSSSNTITTSGGSKINVGSDGSGTVKSTGSDVMSLMNIVSTLKTAYTVATTGISNSIMAGFTGVSDALAGAGMWGASAGVSNFGYGFANPFSYGAGNGAFGSTMAGGALSAGLIGGAVGYGTGWLGDKLLGANSYAGIGGALGGATGGILASLGVVGGPLGIIAGSLIGSALGGIFGKKKETDSGVEFFKNMDALDTLSNQTVQAYTDWEKKGWFSRSNGTSRSDLTASQMRQIETVFDTYDYLLNQLGDSDKIWLEAGKYSKETYQDALTKNFIKAFTDVDQSVDSTIYDMWKAYADSANKSVLTAMSDSINSYITSTRDFEKWSLERDGNTFGSLQKQAQWAQADFENLANMIGATGVTVENYTQMYAEAIKSSFDADTITKWQQLGTALRTATDAGDAYKEALLNQITAQLNAWKSALGSIQGAIDNLNPVLKSFDELRSTTVSLDNYSTLLSQLESTRQSEITKLQTAYQTRVDQLNREKTMFESLSDYLDELRYKLIGASNTSDISYFYDELAKAKATFTQGGVVNTSNLTKSANTYLDNALKNSASQLEYFREVAKVRDGISGLGSMVTGGTLESVEAAIKTEEQTLAQKLDTLNQTALAILNGWKGTATSAISDLTNRQNIVKKNLTDQWVTNKDGSQTYQSSYGAVANRDTVTDDFTVATTQGTKNSIQAGVELYQYVQAYGEQAGYAKAAEYGLSPAAAEGLYWIGNAYNGSHAGGLQEVPFDGYIAQLHKGERVKTAKEAKEEDVSLQLIKTIENLIKQLVSNRADDIRLRQFLQKLAPDGDRLNVNIGGVA